MNLVQEFMILFEQPIATTLGENFNNKSIKDLRWKLILEESKELLCGLVKSDLVEIADALSDILYVIYGTGLSFGFALFDFRAQEFPKNSILLNNKQLRKKTFYLISRVIEMIDYIENGLEKEINQLQYQMNGLFYNLNLKN